MYVEGIFPKTFHMKIWNTENHFINTKNLFYPVLFLVFVLFPTIYDNNKKSGTSNVFQHKSWPLIISFKIFFYMWIY